MIDINTKVHFTSDGKPYRGVIVGYEGDNYKITYVGAGIYETFKMWIVPADMVTGIVGV